VLLVWYRTCDLQIVGLSPGWASLHSGLGQATYTCVPLSPSGIIWYRPRGVISLAGKVTAGLAEMNSSLPPTTNVLKIANLYYFCFVVFITSIPNDFTVCSCACLVVHFIFVHCKQLRNDSVNAMRDYQRAIQLDPNYALAYYNAANIYFFGRQFKQVSAVLL